MLNANVTFSQANLKTISLIAFVICLFLNCVILTTVTYTVNKYDVHVIVSNR